MFVFLLLLVVAYCIGSISSAVLVCKALGLPDPRTEGSKNAGATNVLRVGGKKAAAMVLCGDLLKGYLVIVLPYLLGSGESALLAFLGVAAVIGHIYPCFFGFKGGKGVATAFGVLLGLSWKLAVICVIVWALVVAIYRISSLASISASLAAPVFCVWFASPAFIAPIGVMTLIILAKHYPNISRLIDGEEPKIGDSKKP